MTSETAATKGAQQTQTESPFDKLLAKEVRYVPFGEKEAIDLTYGQVTKFLAVPTKRGEMPTHEDIINFMMLCKARELNPWAGDAFLCGYDTKDGPQFSCITSIQAMFKRAEACPAFDGIESGVIVRTGEGAVEHREGAFLFDGENVLGGWARCYRKDRKVPFYDAIKFSVYSTGYARWSKDPGGMIQKCARSAVLRPAFPTQLGRLYIREEMEHLADAEKFPTGAVQPSDGLAGIMGLDTPAEPLAPLDELVGVEDTVGEPASETPEEKAERLQQAEAF